MAMTNRISLFDVRGVFVTLNLESSDYFDVTVSDLVSVCCRNPDQPPESFPYGGMKLEMDRRRG
jgi:hypothetical protein